MKTQVAPIEILEARIAPATFLVSGGIGAGNNPLTVFKVGTGDVTSANPVAVMDSGADVAVLLSAGDTLVYDLNGDQLVSKGEPTLVKVTSGQAMAFFTDTNSSLAFDLNEFTGLALTDGAKVAVTADVFGPVGTALNSTGDFVKTGILGSITGLGITGEVHGNIFAGGSISGLTIKSAKGALATEPNVAGQIATGSAAQVGESFDGGNTVNLIDFSGITPAGSNGGDIVKLTLDKGALAILASDGADGTTGGNGGSIIDLTVTKGVRGINIQAGGGADGTAGAGGNGGVVSGAKVTLNLGDTESVYLSGGNGGTGTGGNGGNGGDVTKSSINLPLNSGPLYFVGGNGGGADVGNGGHGGSVTDENVKVALTTQSVSVDGGTGGTVTMSGDGGAGGSVAGLTLSLTGSFQIAGGAGGSGGATLGKGGVGGNVTKLKIANEITFNVAIEGGAGGSGNSADGGDGGAITALTYSGSSLFFGGSNLFASGHGGNVDSGNGNGGAGGVFSDSKFMGLNGMGTQIAGGGGGHGSGSGHGGAGGSLTKLGVGTASSSGQYNLMINAGKGGDGGTMLGAGGAGGNATQVSVKLGIVQLVSLAAGNGGNGSGADGGIGGSLINAQLTVTGPSSSYQIRAGSGGSVLSGDGSGSKGGDILGLKATFAEGVFNGAIAAGVGGSASGNGNGGAGGQFSRGSIVVKGTFGGALNQFGLSGGNGGNADSAGTGKGGDGGELGKIKFSSVFTQPSGYYFLTGGTGGTGYGQNQGGGNSGAVHDVTLTTPNSTVIMGALSAGDGGSGAAAVGGNGGAISNISGQALKFFVAGSDGGNATDGSGGAGSSLSGIKITTPLAAAIIAGDGGDGAVAAGAGGSITNVKISGDIGDFTQPFNTTLVNMSGMGGLVAGQGGQLNGSVDVTKNGTIANVSAARIAAIIAGKNDGTSLSSDNAVRSISGIVTTAIGADLNGDRMFSYTEKNGNPGFDLGSSDVPLDGLVIVASGGFTGTHPTPLELLEV